MPNVVVTGVEQDAIELLAQSLVAANPKGAFLEQERSGSHLPYYPLSKKCGSSLAIGVTDLRAMSKTLQETVLRTRR
jgi:hypothetical protein